MSMSYYMVLVRRQIPVIQCGLVLMGALISHYPGPASDWKSINYSTNLLLSLSQYLDA